MRLLWVGRLGIAAWAGQWTTAAAASTSVRNVAIIGAGAAGSSAAYHLRKFAAEADVAVNITVFEKTGRIGGRTLTVWPYDDPTQSVELGAALFTEQNPILFNASRKFGLITTKDYRDPDGVMGVWDGDKFVLEVDSSLPYWRILLQMLWKYGYQGPRRTDKLMKTAAASFLQLYDSPYFPFKSLTQRMLELKLLEAASLSGEEFLQKYQVSQLYAHDVIQACTRVNYASNLAEIHGLDTLVSVATDGAMAVVGGNWQIFHHMLANTNAAISLNTTVTSIELDSAAVSALDGPKYRLKTVSSAGNSIQDTFSAGFDDVVIATPYQFSKITTENGVDLGAIEEIPYVTLHVTVFASPFWYSSTFFNLTGDKKVPDMVLTTLNDKDGATAGAGKAGFFSMSVLRKVVNPRTKRQEYLYKIFSPIEVTPAFLSNVFGMPVPADFTGLASTDSTGKSHEIKPISWYHAHVFNSYPRATPRSTFLDTMIQPGLYYTSGMESLISTMETNALMGMNVARLIVDDILGVTSGESTTPSVGASSSSPASDHKLDSTKNWEASGSTPGRTGGEDEL